MFAPTGKANDEVAPPASATVPAGAEGQRERPPRQHRAGGPLPGGRGPPVPPPGRHLGKKYRLGDTLGAAAWWYGKLICAVE